MPRHLLPLLPALLLIGCGPDCDETQLTNAVGLAPDAARAAVGKACGVPTAPPEAWNAACSVSVSELGTVAGRQKAASDCTLPASLLDDGQPGSWVHAAGDPAAAAAYAAWLPTVDVPDARVASVVKAIRGKATVNALLTLPSVTGVAPAAPAEWVITPTQVSHNGAKVLDLVAGVPKPQPQTGLHRWAPWRIESLAPGKTTEAPVVAVDASVPLGTLRQVAATIAHKREIQLLATSGDTIGVSRITLGPKGLDAPNDQPVGKAVGTWAATGALSLAGPIPCRAAPDGMLCIAGTDKRGTFYIDKTEVKGKDYRACVADEACPKAAASNLTHDMAVRYCAWAGKRLPTDAEWGRAAKVAGTKLAYLDDGADEWVRSRKWPTTFQVRQGGSTTVEVPASTKAGVRCALTEAQLTRFPPRVKSTPLPVPPDLVPPDPAMVKLFAGIEVDNIERKPLCKKGFSSGLDCRDPESYLVSNEPRADIQLPYIRNRGGGFVGVGTYQNYAYVAIARSQWAWMLDYDPAVVATHRINRAFILASPTPKGFVQYFEPGNEDKAKALLEKEYAGREDLDYILDVYDLGLSQFRKYYRRELAPPKSYLSIGLIQVPEGNPDFGWLRNKDHYDWVRTMWQQDRIVAVPGDMLGSKTMQSIGATAKKMNVPIRIYYTSNAPTAWGGTVTESYRDNVQAFPMDRRSVVIQVLLMPSGFGQTGWWHHSISDGLLHQERVGLGYPKVWHTTFDRIKTDDQDLTLVGLPSD